MSLRSLTTRRPVSALSSAFGDFFEPWNDWFNDSALTRSLTLPKVNISESSSNYNLSVAAPGLHKTDFKIEINGNMLTVSAEKEENKEEKEEKYTHKEYNYSSFSRSFTIPEGVAQDKIEATYDGGVLKLTLPKKETTEKQVNKVISIK